MWLYRLTHSVAAPAGSPSMLGGLYQNLENLPARLDEQQI